MQRLRPLDELTPAVCCGERFLMRRMSSGRTRDSAGCDWSGRCWKGRWKRR